MNTLKSLYILLSLANDFEQEFGEELVSDEWFEEMLKKGFGVDSLKELNYDDFKKDAKFYLNYEIVRLKDKIERELSN